MRAALVTTLRSRGASLEDFVAYHLGIGFDRLFLFFDDPEDAAFDRCSGHPRITAVRNDARLYEHWRRTPVFAGMRRFIHKEVMARQVLNAATAISMARQQSIDWIVHLDVDELFFPGERTDARSSGVEPAGESLRSSQRTDAHVRSLIRVDEHFLSLEDRGLHGVVYANHEAAPEVEDVELPFRDITLFKVNPLAPLRIDAGEADRAVREERRGLFHFYANGKSSARVAAHLRPRGVHEFSPRVQGGFAVSLRAGLAGTRLAVGLTRRGPLVVRRAVRTLLGIASPATLCSGAVILHFACCGFEQFWEKYRMLGRFEDRWFGRARIVDRIGSFHLEARDVVMGGDREAARRFYRERVVFRGPERVTRLLDRDVLCRITGPSRLLSATVESSVQAPGVIPAPLIPSGQTARRTDSPQAPR